MKIQELYENSNLTLKYIRENCQPWLNATDNGALRVYRGIDRNFSSTEYIFKTQVPKNRPPRDSTPLLHYIMMNLISESGKVANRDNSVFVSGNERMASRYGKTFAVLPVGNFHYTWVEHVEDMYANIKYWSELFVKIKDKSTPYIQKLKKELNTEDYEFVLETLISNLGDSSEILKYVEFNSNSPTVTSLIQRTKGDDGSLKEAIKSGNEILISCNEIVYFDADIYDGIFVGDRK